jgi:hypothetical protein
VGQIFGCILFGCIFSCSIIFLAGNTDIHNGNLKLILALLWSLIAHYQLGASNFPPKKLMLAWLRVSVIKVSFVQLFQCSSAFSQGKKNQKSKIKISSNKNFQNIFQKKIPKNVWPKPLITQISTPRQLAKPNHVMLYRMDKCFLFFHSNASQKFQKIYK